VKKLEKYRSGAEEEATACARLHRETAAAVNELKAVTQVGGRDAVWKSSTVSIGAAASPDPRYVLKSVFFVAETFRSLICCDKLVAETFRSFVSQLF